MQEIPPQMHDFIFSQVYSRPVFAQDIIYLANRYSAHYLMNERVRDTAVSEAGRSVKGDVSPSGVMPPTSVGLDVDPQSLKLSSSVLPGTKSKKMADLVYDAHLLRDALQHLLLTLLFEHKLTATSSTLWQMLEYTVLARLNRRQNVIPILTLQSGPVPSFHLAEKARQAVGLPPIKFPCFTLNLQDVPDDELLSPGLTSGVVLFIMKYYEAIRRFDGAGQKATQKALQGFRCLPSDHQMFVISLCVQYLGGLNNELDVEGLCKFEASTLRVDEEAILGTQFKTFMQMWEEQGLEKGMQQGMQQGMEKGQNNILINLLDHLPPERVAEMAKMPLDKVLEVQRQHTKV